VSGFWFFRCSHSQFIHERDLNGTELLKKAVLRLKKDFSNLFRIETLR